MKDRRFVTFCMAICLLLVLVLPLVTGCTKPATEPVKPTEPSKPADSTKTTTLLFASFTPPGDSANVACEAFGKDLEEKSGGRVKVEYSWGGAVGGPPDLYDRLTEGACDIAVILPVATPGRFPVSLVLTLPIYSQEPSSVIITKAFNDLRQKGFLDKEYSEVKNLYVWGMSVNIVMWSKEPVTTIEGFKGKKIKISGGTVKDVLEKLGAVPVSMASAELYGGLQKGTVDGGITGFALFGPYKFYEVAKYTTNINIMSSGIAVAMNKDSYNKLPDDIRAIIDDMAASDKYSTIVGQTFEDDRLAGEKIFLDNGGKESTLSDADMMKMDTMLAPIWTKWISDMEAQGQPAKEILAELYSSLKSQGVKKPFIGYTPPGM